MRNMSFRVKLPLMISLLVCIVLAVTAVVSYTVAAVITLDKSKDEIKATSDRVGAGLYASLSLEEQSTFLITTHRTFQDLLEIRNTDGQEGENFFSENNELLDKASGILADSLAGMEGNNSLILLDRKVDCSSIEEALDDCTLTASRRDFLKKAGLLVVSFSAAGVGALTSIASAQSPAGASAAGSVSRP